MCPPGRGYCPVPWGPRAPASWHRDVPAPPGDPTVAGSAGPRSIAAASPDSIPDPGHPSGPGLVSSPHLQSCAPRPPPPLRAPFPSCLPLSGVHPRSATTPGPAPACSSCPGSVMGAEPQVHPEPPRGIGGCSTPCPGGDNAPHGRGQRSLAPLSLQSPKRSLTPSRGVSHPAETLIEPVLPPSPKPREHPAPWPGCNVTHAPPQPRIGLRAAPTEQEKRRKPKLGHKPCPVLSTKRSTPNPAPGPRACRVKPTGSVPGRHQTTAPRSTGGTRPFFFQAQTSRQHQRLMSEQW